MRKQLSKSVRSLFATAVKQRFPAFTDRTFAWQVPSQVWVYQYDFQPDLWFFIMLVISPQQDSFTIELAWSPVGTLPHSRTAFLPTDPPQDDGMRIRLPFFWTNRDEWWKLGKELSVADFAPDQILSRLNEPEAANQREIELKVAESVERLFQHGMPYLAQVAVERGYEPPLLTTEPLQMAVEF